MKILNTKIIMFMAMIAVIMTAATHSEAATRTDIKKMVIEEAGNSNVPPALALALAKVESDFNKNALSSAGARGVMQIMPKTAKDEFGVDAEELWNAKLNIQLGIDFLSRLYKQYDESWELALSHYNGGTLDKRGSRAIPHSYTRAYVDAVLRWWRRYEDQSTVWRLAAADKLNQREDGWSPALTKVRDKVRNKVRAKLRKKRAKRRSARLRDGWKRRGYRRNGVSGKTRIYTSWRSRYDRYHDDDDSFDQRRLRARDTLDDFGPNAEWRKG